MASTSVYALPFQALTDPPNGAGLGQDLAEAVETELARIDAEIAANEVHLVGGKRYTSAGNAVSGVAATEVLVNMDSGLVTLAPGRQYRIPVRIGYLPSGASLNYWWLRLRKTNVAGAVWANCVFATNQNLYGMNLEFTLVPPPVAAQTTDTYVLTVQRLGGPDTLTILRGGTDNPTYVLVEDAGPAARVTAA